MSFYDDLKKKLSPEQFNSVIDALGDDFDFDMVPRSRLNQVIRQRNELREQVAQQPSTSVPQSVVNLAHSATAATPNEAVQQVPEIDLEQIKAEIQSTADQRVRDIQMQYAAILQLQSANVVDPEVVWNAGLIDKSKLVLDDSGVLTGLEEQLETLKGSKAYLFNLPQEGVGTGKAGGEGSFQTITSLADLMALPSEQQAQFKVTNPALFQQFLGQL